MFACLELSQSYNSKASSSEWNFSPYCQTPPKIVMWVCHGIILIQWWVHSLAMTANPRIWTKSSIDVELSKLNGWNKFRPLLRTCTSIYKTANSIGYALQIYTFQLVCSEQHFLKWILILEICVGQKIWENVQSVHFSMGDTYIAESLHLLRQAVTTTPSYFSQFSFRSVKQAKHVSDLTPTNYSDDTWIETVRRF